MMVLAANPTFGEGAAVCLRPPMSEETPPSGGVIMSRECGSASHGEFKVQTKGAPEAGYGLVVRRKHQG